MDRARREGPDRDGHRFSDPQAVEAVGEVRGYAAERYWPILESRGFVQRPPFSLTQKTARNQTVTALSVPNLYLFGTFSAKNWQDRCSFRRMKSASCADVDLAESGSADRNAVLAIG